MEKTHLDINEMGRVVTKIIELFHIKIIIAFLFAYLASVFKSNYDILISLYLLILFDTITGVYVAIRAQTVSSRGFYRVAIKCLVYFIMLIVGRLVDKHCPVAVSSSIMDSFLVITESISILENLGKLGFPVPTKLLNILKITKDKK